MATARDSPAAGADADLTIDELARRTGMTVRNIRAHQSRGLLPPPDVRGRVGYYGRDHIARLELIKELQADGFSLEVIRRFLDNASGSTDEVLRFTRTLRAPFDEEQPEIVDLETLVERAGGERDPRLLEQALKIGILRDLGNGHYEVRSPLLARASAELHELGVPVSTILEVTGRLRRHADGVAESFVRLFLEAVWEPFERDGSPAGRWPEVLEALERLRPLATESLVAIFGVAMTDAVEEAFGRELERMGRPRSRSKRGPRA